MAAIDDDFPTDTILVDNISDSFAVPAGQIVHGLVTFPPKDATISNSVGEIVGPAGGSNEGTSSDPAEIAFEISLTGANPQSGNTSVVGEQP